MTHLWWLSFCDNARPSGHKFLGACIVQGGDMIEAVKNAHANGCNPGGEVRGHQIPELLVGRLPAHRIGVLLDKSTAENFDSELLPLRGGA